MKLLIKLYNPDGTCEEIRDKEFTYQYLTSQNAVKILERNIQDISFCADKGGRIEIAPIVE